MMMGNNRSKNNYKSLHKEISIWSAAQNAFFKQGNSDFFAVCLDFLVFSSIIGCETFVEFCTDDVTKYRSVLRNSRLSIIQTRRPCD